MTSTCSTNPLTLLRGLGFAATFVISTSVACGDDSAGAGDYGYMPDQLPSGEECETSGGATDGCAASDTGPPSDGSVGSPCESTEDCHVGLACSAPFDGDRGDFACVDACIDIMDEARWCADASACCDPEATCTMRGYCVLSDDSTSTSGDTSGSSTSGASGTEASGGIGSTTSDSDGSTSATGTTGT